MLTRQEHAIMALQRRWPWCSRVALVPSRCSHHAAALLNAVPPPPTPAPTTHTHTHTLSLFVSPPPPPPPLPQSIQSRGLAKEAQQRLNEFMDVLRNMATADLSAKNLGDEGFAYVVDALSFNDRCAGLGVCVCARACGWVGVRACGGGGGGWCVWWWWRRCLAKARLEGLPGSVGLRRVGLAAAPRELPSLSPAPARSPSPDTCLPPGHLPPCRCVAADFSKNGIGPQGCAQLCQVLTSNSGLKTLLLDTNTIGDEGAAMLATVRGWGWGPRRRHAEAAAGVAAEGGGAVPAASHAVR